MKIKSTGLILSILSGLMLLAVLMIMGNAQSNGEKFDIGDYSAYKIEQIENQYLNDNKNENLVLLLKVLCYKHQVEGDKSLSEKIALYGAELTIRAKKEQIDLQTIDDEKIMLQIIDVINSIE